MHTKPVDTHLVMYPQKDQQRTGQTGRETDQVDQKCTLELFKVPEDQDEVVSKHSMEIKDPSPPELYQCHF